MMAKPMRKLSTGLSSWGIRKSGSLLGTDVSEDITDGEEVVTLVELIQFSREEVEAPGMQNSLSPPGRDNTALRFKNCSIWPLT